VSGSAYEDANATWSDIVDGSGVVATVDRESVLERRGVDLGGRRTVTKGNDAPTVTRTVRVVDTTVPLIT